MTDLNYDFIADKMLNYLNIKFTSETINNIKLDKNKIINILEKKKNLLKSKEGITIILNTIEVAVKTQLNGANTKLKNLNISKFTQDNNVNIPYQKYTENIIDLNKESIDNNILETTGKGILSTDQDNYYEDDNILENRNLMTELINNNNIEVYLFIDSKDRDYEKFKFANNFEIKLSDKGLKKIKKIELIDVILIDSSSTEMSSDNLSIPPYIILELEGLPNMTHGLNCGSNKILNNTFAILDNYELKNGYKYYKNINMIKEFNNTFDLDKLIIKYKLPDGNLFNFGHVNNESINTINFLKFKITL